MNRLSPASGMRPLVLKLGGELLESAEARDRIAGLARTLTSLDGARGRPLVIVHGGGRAIDVELARRQITPRKIDGLRVTDADTLDAVIAVLAGSANTELVASLVAAGVAAVGLTGVDAGFGRASRSGAHRSTSGAVVDLGLVGDPTDLDASLVTLLTKNGFVPVVASLGMSADGQVLNVNADVMACRLAAALGDCDLVIAGTTAGVLDDNGRSIAGLDVGGIDELISDGTATAGMVAKLSACRTALLDGVGSVRLVDGRTLGAGSLVADATGTTLRLADRREGVA